MALEYHEPPNLLALGRNVKPRFSRPSAHSAVWHFACKGRCGWYQRTEADFEPLPSMPSTTRLVGD